MISTISSGVNFQIRAGLSGYIAEMNAAFCCASLGITPTVRHADYIGSWLDVLREDNRAIVRAASQASKAANWLLAFLPETDIAGEPANDRRAA
jgi:antirestriction protein ArdC